MITDQREQTIEVAYITIVCIVGFIGNATQLFVLLSNLRRKPPVNSFSVRTPQAFVPLRGFMMYLAIFDSILLVNSWVLFAMHRVLVIHPKNLSYVPVAYGINHYCLAAHIWGTVALTFDRCLAVCCPVWNKTKKPVKFGYILLLASTILSAVYALPSFFELTVQAKGKIEPNISYTIARYPYAQHSHANASQLYLIGYKIVAKMVFTTCIPVVCLIFCTTIMIYTLEKQFKTRKASNMLIRKQLHTATNIHVDTLNQVLSTMVLVPNSDTTSTSLQIPLCRRKSQPVKSLRKTQAITNHARPRRIYQPLIVVLVKAIACYSMPLLLNIMECSGIDRELVRVLSIISNCLIITEASCNFYIYIAMSEQYRNYVYNALVPKRHQSNQTKDHGTQRRQHQNSTKAKHTQNGIEVSNCNRAANIFESAV